MADAIDRRLWSITARGLSELVGDLASLGIYSTSVRNLQKILKNRGIYPARDFEHRCQPLPPDAFFTYHSVENFIDIQEIVWRSFDFSAGLLLENRADLEPFDMERMVADGIRLWVDFVFIDQSSRDIPGELEALPDLLGNATAHFVLGELPLTRAWCCHEIALFHRDSAKKMDADPSLLSFTAPTSRVYHGWDLVEVTEPEDKSFIEDSIRSDFPNGFDGFDYIMNAANSTASLSSAYPGDFFSPEALQSLASAAETWYTRTGDQPAH